MQARSGGCLMAAAMKWTFERIFLAVSMLVFLGLGVWLFAVPEALNGLGIEMQEPDARVDVRATYGGLDLGIAAFLIWCLFRDAWVRTGLVAVGFLCAGLGTTRLLGIALEGQGGGLMWSFVGIELAVALWLVVYLRRSGGVSSKATP